MSEKFIKVARYRAGDYTVNYDMNGRLLTYKWAGSKDNKVDIKEIPDYVVDWLMMSTTALKSGSLVIVPTEETKDLIENIDNEDEFKNNIHTREEVIKMLEGNFNKMKSELNKITEKSEKQFITDIAQEIKIDSASKREFLAKWIGVEVEMLFASDDEE